MKIRPFAATVAAVALTLSLNACSGDPKSKPAAVKETSAIGDVPTVGATKEGIEWCKNVDPKTFKPVKYEGKVVYTPTQFADAYCELITFNGIWGASPGLAVTDREYSKIDILPLQPWFTPLAWEDVVAFYDKAIKAKGTNTSEILELIFAVSETSDDADFYNHDLLTAGRRWSPANYSYDTVKDKVSGAIRIHFEVTFEDDFVYQDREEPPVQSTKTRKLEISMSPTANEKGDHQWQIDGWNGIYTYTDFIPYKGPIPENN